MGKQRTPQGRQTGRGTPPRKPQGPAPVAAETIEAAAPEGTLPESSAEPLHAQLMDTVSPEALGTATPASEPVEAPVPADANLAEAAPAEPVAAQAPKAAADIPAAEAASDPDLAPTLPAVDASPVAGAYANVVPLKSLTPPAKLPEPAEPAEAPAQPSDGALPAPASWRAGHRAGVPIRQDLEGMGETLFAFMRNESSAALAHLNALKDVRSPADAIRLQVNEIQRAADASLTCWSEIARRATRIVAHR